MIFLLKYYYGLECPNVFKDGKYTYVKEKKKIYMLYKVENIHEFNEIVKLLTFNNNSFDRIVTTKDNRSYIYYQNNTYALIEITKENRDYQNLLTNKIKINNASANNLLNRSNWYFLWCNKIDYFKEEKKRITEKEYYEMSDYYTGMAESAIQYFNAAINKESQERGLYISHKRITDNKNANPMNIVIDRKERDIAEYIKYLILTDKYSERTVGIILEKISTENLTTELIFARVLFPTYYFDMCEELILQNNKKKFTTKQINNYERTLNIFYNQLCKIKKIKKVDWL